MANRDVQTLPEPAYITLYTSTKDTHSALYLSTQVGTEYYLHYILVHVEYDLPGHSTGRNLWTSLDGRCVSAAFRVQWGGWRRPLSEMLASPLSWPIRTCSPSWQKAVEAQSRRNCWKFHSTSRARGVSPEHYFLGAAAASASMLVLLFSFLPPQQQHDRLFEVSTTLSKKKHTHPQFSLFLFSDNRDRSVRFRLSLL